MKKIFRYIENFWIGADGKPSIRRVLAMLMSIDFVLNVHKSVDILYKIVLLYFSDKSMDPVAISSLGSGVSNLSMIIGMEAALIGALLALTTYQNSQFTKTDNSPSESAPNSQD